MHERTIIERAVQFEPPALSREEILFTRDDTECKDISEECDIPLEDSDD